MSVAIFKFDGETYAEGNDKDFQQLLEAISDAVQTEAWTDSELSTDAEREEAVSQTWDGTSRSMAQWDNLMAIMQMCPYELNVERVEVTLELAVQNYMGEWFPELLENETAVKLANSMIDWAVPVSDPMRDETLSELMGQGNDGARILDSVDAILRERV